MMEGAKLLLNRSNLSYFFHFSKSILSRFILTVYFNALWFLNTVFYNVVLHNGLFKMK